MRSASDAGGPARVRCFYNADPTARTGFENHGSCLTPTFHGHTDDETIGVRSVPRSVFESSGPANLS